MPAILLGNDCSESTSSTAASSATSFNTNLRKLVSGVHTELQKRDMWYTGGSDPARYAFFAFFIAGIVIFLIMVCLVNAKRMKEGRTPMISAYLAPPSYHQSQVAYEGQTATNLPTYTAAADINQDVGYYDKNGNFIPTKTESADGTTLEDDNNNNNNLYNNIEHRNGSIELTDTPNMNEANFTSNTANETNPFSQYDTTATDLPQQAHTDSNINDPELSDMVYRRPDAPPPTRTYNTTYTAVGSSTKTEDEELPPYEAPELPKKTHFKS